MVYFLEKAKGWLILSVLFFLAACVIINTQDRESIQPDSYEKDDSFAKAKVIEVNNVQQRTLHLSNDVDCIYFSNKEALWYTIELHCEGVVCDLYDTTTTNLIWSLTNDVKEEMYGDGKSYFLKVYFGDQKKYKNTTYQISYTAILPDAYENDDNEANSKLLLVNTSQKRTFHTTNDCDFIHVESIPGVWYTINVSLSSLTSNYVVQVIDKESSQKVIDRTNISSLTLVGDGGEYYIKIFRIWTTNLRPTEYTISFSALEWPDTAEPNDDFASAPRIEKGTLYNYTLHRTNDIDYMKIGLIGDSYCVIEKMTTSPFMILEVYNASKTRILSKTNAVYAEFPVSSTEDYYIKVFFDPTVTLLRPTNYTLKVNNYSPDSFEPNNTSSSATSLSPLISYNASLHAPSDVDWYSFTNLPGVNHIFRFSYQGKGGLIVSLLNSSGQILKSVTNSSYVNWETFSKDTYYLRVEYNNSGQSFSPVQYTFSMEFNTSSGIPVDQYEFDDIGSEVKDHSLDTTYSHSLHWTNDVDYMSFSAPTTSKYYRFDLSTSGLQVEVLQSGTVVKTISNIPYFTLPGSSLGSYTFKVSLIKGNNPLQYTIRGKYIAPDPYENSMVNITNTIVFTLPMTNTIHAPGDVDYWMTTYSLYGLPYIIRVYGDRGIKVSVYNYSFSSGASLKLVLLPGEYRIVASIDDRLFLKVEMPSQEDVGEYSIIVAPLLK